MGTRNSTIRATWSPRVSLVEQCTNMHQMGNRKVLTAHTRTQCCAIGCVVALFHHCFMLGPQLLFRDRAGTFDEHLHSRIEPIPLTSFAGVHASDVWLCVQCAPTAGVTDPHPRVPPLSTGQCCVSVCSASATNATPELDQPWYVWQCSPFTSL